MHPWVGNINVDSPALFAGRIQQFLIILLLFLWHQFASAASILELNDKQSSYKLGKYISVLEDPGGTLDISAISSPEFKDKYKTFSEDSPNLGYSNSAFWVRLTLKNNSSKTHWVLDQAFANTNHVDLYYFDDKVNKYRLIKSGSLVPYNKRAVKHRRSIFNLSLANNQQKTFYLRIKNTTAINLNLILWDKESFILADHDNIFWMGVFYGTLIILFAANLSLAVFFGKKSYIYLSAVILSIITIYMFFDGYAQTYFSEKYINISYSFLPILMCIAILSLVLYSNEIILNTLNNTFLVKLNRNILYIISFFILIIPLLNPAIVMKIIIPLILVTFIYIMAVGVLGWRKENLSARLIVVGFFLVFVSLFSVALVRFGLFESNVVIENSIRSSLVVLMLLMSMAIINEMKNTQHAVRVGETRYRALFESANDAIFLLKEKDIVDCNSKALEMFAGKRKDIINSNPVKLSPEYQPDGTLTADKTTEVISLVIKEGPQVFEWKHQRLDGSLFDAEVSLKKIEIDEDVYLQGIVRDITRRKKTESAIKDIAVGVSASSDDFFRELVMRLSRLFDADFAFIGILDKDNKLQVNTLALAINGEIADNISYSLVGTPCENVLDDATCSYSEGVQNLFPDDKLLADMGVDSYIGTPLYDSDKKPIGLIVVLDRKPMKHVEFMQEIMKIYGARASSEYERCDVLNQLKLHRDNLEELVKLRVFELEQVNNELESFAYSVSHDLRAPLRSISGFSQAILEDYGEALDEQGVQMLDRVIQNTEKMSTLIDSLLVLSRLGRKELSIEKVDLTALFSSALEQMESQEQCNCSEIIINELGEYQMDKDLMMVVIQNLLSNACKYSSKQTEPRVEVGREIKDNSVVYYVKDNGVGFDMAYADKLFGAFQRLHKAEEFEGIGIGLVTVQRIIHRHGGKVWANSEPGKGATFYFTLG